MIVVLLVSDVLVDGCYHEMILGIKLSLNVHIGKCTIDVMTLQLEYRYRMIDIAAENNLTVTDVTDGIKCTQPAKGNSIQGTTKIKW